MTEVRDCAGRQLAGSNTTKQILTGERTFGHSARDVQVGTRCDSVSGLPSGDTEVEKTDNEGK